LAVRTADGYSSLLDNRVVTSCGRTIRVRSWLAEAEARHAQRSVPEEVASAILVAAPALAMLYVLVGPALAHAYMPDLKVFLGAGRAVLRGQNPYPSPHAGALLAQGNAFVYPAPAALALVPLAVLPYALAAVIWTAVCLGSISAALLLLDVRDWRCHGAAFMTLWVVNAEFTGSVSPLLLLGLAALWRYRSRPIVSAALLAGLVSLKLFLWPLIFWMALTGRRRAALLGVLLTAVLCLSSWAAIGFRGLEAYPRLLAALASSEQSVNYSPLSLLLGLGSSPLPARIALGILGAGLLCAAAVIVRNRRPSADLMALTLCLIASLICSPIVWPHYLLLLLVPVAIRHNRLSLAWLVPVASWISPGAHSSGPVYVILTLSVAAAALLAAHWTVRDRATVSPGIPASA
jgi:hypothetical protein